MIVSDKFVFIHNGHTGGSFVRKIFEKTFPDSEFKILRDWHMPISKLEPKHRNKLKFGCVRNPWDWYVSYYTHQQPGGPLLKFCLKNKQNTFRNFLTTLLSREFAAKNLNHGFHPVGNPHLPRNVKKFKYMHNLDIGFFTYRYIYMFFDSYEDIFDGAMKFPTVGDKELKRHDKLISVDKICRLETLVPDIIDTFNSAGIKVKDGTKNMWKKHPRENGKPRKHYTEFYTKDLVQLVRHADRLIIKKYGYEYGK